MTSLYEQNPENWDKLADSGKPNLREMAKHFQHPIDMDRALGLNNCTHHWNNGRNGASKGNDLLAKHWLDQQKAQPEAEPIKTTPRMLLIVASAESAAKIEKIAVMIGAEVTDV